MLVIKIIRLEEIERELINHDHNAIMNPLLTTPTTTPQAARDYLTGLHNAGMLYHLDDSAAENKSAYSKMSRAERDAHDNL